MVTNGVHMAGTSGVEVGTNGVKVCTNGTRVGTMQVAARLDCSMPAVNLKNRAGKEEVQWA